MSLNSNHYPNDFIHLILAAHCANQTGSEAGNLKVKNGDSVIFSLENELYKFYTQSTNIDLNEFLIDWIATKVIEDELSGYVGIIYTNEKTKQIVLVHRSTNFESDLKMSNLFKQSGVQADINTVLMGMMLMYQAQGYSATRTALEYALGKGYAFSITGHSLGAWLAELSVYYCNTVFEAKYPNAKYVKVVTFDGPGSREMMEKMSASSVGEKFDLESLYIVRYVSSPNIVNCANKHVGIMYRLFPDIDINILESICKNDGNNGLIASGLEWLKGIFITWFNGKAIHDGLIATLWHDLKYILPQFNTTTGKPHKYEEVKSWPSITHKEFGSSRKGPLSKFIDYNLSKLVKVKVFKMFIGYFTKSLDTTTLGSIFMLASDYKEGKIRQSEFWNTYKYLNKINTNRTDNFDLNDFYLKFKAQYRTDPVDEYSLNGELHGLDRFFEIIKQNVNKINKGTNNNFASKVEGFARLYYRNRVNNSIVIKDEFRDKISINPLRDYLRKLLYNNQKEFAHIDQLDDLSMLYIPTAFLPPNSTEVLHSENDKMLTEFCSGLQANWADFNGDGKLDLFCSDNEYGEHFVWVSTGDGLKPSNQYPSGALYIEGENEPLTSWCMRDIKLTTQIEENKIRGQLALIDFNGDGKTDLACSTKDGIYYILLSKGTALTSVNEGPRGKLTSLDGWCKKDGNLESRWIDFNGDKMSDLLCSNIKEGEHYILVSRGSGLISPNQYPSGILYVEGQEELLGKWCVTKKGRGYHNSMTLAGKLRVADFNGDGKMDLICISSDGKLYGFLSTGEALNSVNEDSQGELKLQGRMNDKALHNWCPTDGGLELNLLDFNGDGKADFSCYGGGELKVLLSDGGKRLRSIDPNHPDGKLKISGDHGIFAKHCTAQNMYWIDINKDNKTDILCFTKDNSYALFSTGESLEFRLIHEKQESKNLCLEHIEDNGMVFALGSFNDDKLIDIVCSLEGSHAALLGWNKLNDEHSVMLKEDIFNVSN
jgi:hypothetical protein